MLKLSDESILSCFMINFQFLIYSVKYWCRLTIDSCMSLIENLPKETAIKFLAAICTFKSWVCICTHKKSRWTGIVTVCPELPSCSFSCSVTLDTQTMEESPLYHLVCKEISSFKDAPNITFLLLKSLGKPGIRITGKGYKDKRGNFFYPNRVGILIQRACNITIVSSKALL